MQLTKGFCAGSSNFVTIAVFIALINVANTFFWFTHTWLVQSTLNAVITRLPFKKVQIIIDKEICIEGTY